MSNLGPRGIRANLSYQDPNFNGNIGTTSPSKNPHAVALGRLGGLKGGPARAKRLSKQKRKEIARKAALARWEK